MALLSSGNASFSLRSVDCLFIDALHQNAFAKLYTRRLLRPLAAQRKRKVSVFVHDIFNPFLIADFRPCEHAADREGCLSKAVASYSARNGGIRNTDLIYAADQPAGEGPSSCRGSHEQAWRAA